LQKATKDAHVTNSLGMKFVPVPHTSILMCIHETRYQDWAAYAGAEIVNPRWKVSLNGVKEDQLDDYPIKNVTHDDAVGFCKWMTRKEGKTYRLPTDQEWSYAVGIGEQEDWNPGATPESRSGKLKEVFPWGTAWPPPSGAGNFADSSWYELDPIKHQFISGYSDGFATVAPVMSFQPNSLGIYDLGGNLTEWVEDWWNAEQKDRAARGSSLAGSDRGKLFSSTRYHLHPSIFYANGGWGFRCVLELPPP
jgi:formylglycine-generating enzyme required for sulfatase activity